MAILSDLAEIAQDYATHRDLLWQLVLRDLRVRYKQAALGFLWALFMPALLVLAGLLFRQAMGGDAGSGVASGAVGGLALRSLLWANFAAAVSFGTASLVGNATLVGKIYFPREVLPLAAVLSSAVDGLVGVLVLASALPWLGGRLSAALLWIPLLLVLLLVLASGMALALSAANLFFRDVKYIVQALLTVGVFFTPVFYTAAELPGASAWILRCNPLAPLLDGAQLAVFGGHNLARPLIDGGTPVWSPAWLGYSAALAVAGLVIASVLFHRVEDAFAERL